ncbi:MAG: hypothetical protein NT013_10775 [Planctomycetia bacterium]|nr:hypothetical protein [Planctomycetia bacterium]
MSPPNHRVASNDQPQSRKHIASISVVVAVVVASVGIWWYMSPGRWLQQAELILVSDPAQADALAEAAINANTGKLSQAWLIRCRAQLALEKPLEALGAYALIKQPDQCAVSDWCALIEEAQAAHHTLLTDMALSVVLRLGSERARILTIVLPLKANTLSEPEVLELVQELRRLAGTSAESWRAIGVTEQIRGRFAESLEAYRQAVTQSDVSQRIGVSSRRELAQLLIVLGQFSAAEPLVAETLDAQITCSEDQLRLAQLRQATGDQVNAEKLLNEVLLKEPDNLPARLLRGTLFVELHQLTNAQDDFEHCLRVAPFHDEAHYRMSQILRRQGNSSGAAKHLQESRRVANLKLRVLEINRRRETSLQDPQILEEMADVYDALGQSNSSSEWRRAAEALRKSTIPGQ